MSIHIQATYKAGLLHPDRPLGLPDNTQVDLTVIAIASPVPIDSKATVPISRPPAPQFSAEELATRLNRYAVAAGTLPTDFSRSDIYNDHD